MNAQSFISVITLAVLVAPPLHADVVPGRWEKVDTLPPEAEIIVTLKAGARLECVLKESGADDLTVITSTGGQLKVAKSEVEEVETIEKDGVRDGVLIGAAIGFAGPVIVTLVSGVDRTEVSLGFAVGVIGAGVGAAVGYLMDKSHKGTEVLYQAP